MKTKFGPEAKNGDYVLVTHVRHMSGTAYTYAAKVYNDKAYTGQGMGDPRSKKFIHKLTADVVIPESYVSEENKKLIEEDIRNEEEKKSKKMKGEKK